MTNPILSQDITTGSSDDAEITKPLQPPAPLDPLTANLLSEAQTSFPYLVYDVEVEYEYNSGMTQLPVSYSPPSTNPGSGPTPYAKRNSCSIIQSASPYGTKKVTFHIVRQSVKPVAPNPVPTSDNETLLTAKLRIIAPKVQEDGVTVHHEIRAEYLYILSRPYFTDDTLSAGSTQADNLTVQENSYGPENFQAGMV